MLGILYVFVVSLLGAGFLNGDKNSPFVKLQWPNGGWGLFVQDRSEWNQKTSQLFCEASWHQSEASCSVFSDYCIFLLVSSWWWLVWCWGVPEYACIVVCRSSVGFRWILSSFDCFQYLCVWDTSCMMHAEIHANSNRYFNHSYCWWKNPAPPGMYKTLYCNSWWWREN